MTDKTSQETQTVDENKRRVHRLLTRGAGLLGEGKAQDAIPPLERAYEIDPASVPVLINLGGAYVMAGRHKEAIPLMEAAREAEPDNAMVWMNLGAAYLGNPILATEEQQMQAISAFEEVLRLQPNAPSVHYNLGLIFVDRGERDLAIAAFRQACQANPQDRDAMLWLQKLESGEEMSEDG